MQCHDRGRAHPPAFGLDFAGVDDGVVGARQGGAHRLFRRGACCKSIVQDFGDDLGRHAAGQLAALLPAHAVGDKEKMMI